MITEKLIVSVVQNSPAAIVGIRGGDRLVSVNGAYVPDVFEYRLLIQDCVLSLCVRREDRVLDFRIEKDEDEDVGLVFETGLMDTSRGCENNCVFCFIAQNPPGMRETLYFRDDDFRLSFLTGNYITMTNMTRRDVDRLIRYHLSPMNISVQAVNPDVRRAMLRNKRACELTKMLKRLQSAGISMNFQIVLCKGINDGDELVSSVRALAGLMPQALSLSVVPVGLTRYREKLFPLEPFTRADAREVIGTINALADEFREARGTAFVWAADEFYITAGLPIPSYSAYEGFPQLENGVGMAALFLSEFDEEINATEKTALDKYAYIVTGQAAAGIITYAAERMREKFTGLETEVIVVKNTFFGETVTVSGLLTGQDILAALQGNIKPNAEVYIPKNALRAGEDVFLDDMTLSGLERALDARITAVPVDGAEFVRAVSRGSKA